MSWDRWRVQRTAGGGWSRRAVLGGAAALITLPWLRSIAPADAGADAPVRLLWWFTPNGASMGYWTPDGVGAQWTPGPTLSALGDLKAEATVLSGVDNIAGLDRTTGFHSRGAGTFLTSREIAPVGVRAGVSVDQVAAAALGGVTPLRSLQVGVPDGGVTCEGPYSCIYNTSLSWADAVTPLAVLTNPSIVFDRLFAGLSPAMSGQDRLVRAALQRSVLDHAVADVGRLQPRLDSEDRQRLDSYLTSVRELEQRINQDGTRACTPPIRPAPDLVDPELALDAMTRLVALALQCDLTRYVTFMMGGGGSQRDMSFMGVHDLHHDLSHHMNDPVALARQAQVDAWEVGWFARLGRLLRDIPEGSGTLLDHTLMMFGAEMSDSNVHDTTNLPLLLLGRGGGCVQPDRHLVYDHAPLADLHIAMLQAAGLVVGGFGQDGTRPLRGLLVGA